MHTLFDQDNRLFTLARGARRHSGIVLALILSPVLVYGAAIAGSILGGLLLGPLSDGGPLLAEAGSELRNILIFGLTGLLLAGWLRWYEGRPLWTVGLERRPQARPFLAGWLISVTFIAGTTGLAALLGGASVAPNFSPLGDLMAILLSLLIIASRFVQGGVEELVFRGWMLQSLGLRYRPWVGVAASSVIFSLIHIANAGFLPLATLNIALIGLFCALYALREGSLWGVIALHAGLNWAQANLFGLPASGHTVGTTLLNVQLAGPELITGGAFGLENSLVMTVVALLAVGVELALAARRVRATAAGLPVGA
jgi:membrane protease YdiL (CAAX protease family)